MPTLGSHVPEKITHIVPSHSMSTGVCLVFGQPDISTGDFDSKQIRGRKHGLQRIALLKMAGYTKKVLLNNDSWIRTTSLVLTQCRTMSSYTGSRKMGKPPLEESCDMMWIFFLTHSLQNRASKAAYECFPGHQTSFTFLLID